MSKSVGMALVLVGVAALLYQVSAQPSRQKDGEKPGSKSSVDYSKSSIVVKMMAFDKNKDGKLTKEEVTDTRLHRLFDRADKNKDGVVTKEELVALAKELADEDGDERGGRGFGGRGPGGRGPDDEGPGGRGPGGRGPGGFGPPRPGQILPGFLQDRLNLTAKQKKALGALQKEVDAKLAKILTDEQKKQLEEMGSRGPGGRGPGGRGPGGRGPGGPPDRD